MRGHLPEADAMLSALAARIDSLEQGHVHTATMLGEIQADITALGRGITTLTHHLSNPNPTNPTSTGTTGTGTGGESAGSGGVAGVGGGLIETTHEHEPCLPALRETDGPHLDRLRVFD